MDYNSLFALKLYYEDEYEDEHDIIRMLKIELINQGMQENEVNIKLKEFYNSFGSNIDLKIFKNIKIIKFHHTNIYIFIVYIFIIYIYIFIIENINNLIFALSNIFMLMFINNIINHSKDIINYNENIISTHDENIISTLNKDVITTLNEEDINNLNKYILKNNLEDKCSICLDDMKINQEVIELQCNHIYHSNCINEYLTNYNYKCPCCKEEIGRPVYNI